MNNHTEGVETAGLSHLIENVRADPGLTPTERETTINWVGDSDHATIYTEERGVMLSVLRSPIARIHTLRISDEGRFGATVPPDEYTDGDVTGVRATVPIGAVKIKSEARNSNQRNLVVSDYGGGDSE